MSFHAEVLADSRNKEGNRLTTFVITFPRIILAEFNTHRALSRNSASSRAIPFAKMVKMVSENPFVPLRWMKDHKGMQGTQYFDDPVDIAWLKADWIESSQRAIEEATRKHSYKEGLSKQICNRLLEPFMWHTAIVTATEWENYFALRAHEAAEIHIEQIAKLMLEVYNASTPRLLEDDEWHIPFGDSFDDSRIQAMGYTSPEQLQDAKVKIATARCARVSYLNFEGKDDYNADIKLHDDLSKSGHWSPFEHCARPMELFDTMGMGKNDWCGNFRGFVQYRKTFQGENRQDPRVLKK